MGASTLTNAGIACIIAAIIGGGLKAFGIEIPLISSWKRQIILALAGLFFIVVADEAPVIRSWLWPTPTAIVVATRTPTLVEPTRVSTLPPQTSLPPPTAPPPTAVPPTARPPIIQPMAQVAVLGAEHNVIVNGLMGSRFRVGAQLSGLRGRALTLVLRAHPQHNPNVSVLYNGNPNLAWVQVQPSSDQEMRDDHVLFLPWDMIQGGPGYYQMFAQVSIFDEAGNALTYSNPEGFWFQRY